MSEKSRDRRRKSLKKDRAAAPVVDPTTVAWMTTLTTGIMCEIGAAATRMYVRWGDPAAKLLNQFSAYLLLAAALIGVVLLVLTALVVRMQRSRPPAAVIVTAIVVGLAPWAAMILQGAR